MRMPGGENPVRYVRFEEAAGRNHRPLNPLGASKKPKKQEHIRQEAVDHVRDAIEGTTPQCPRQPLANRGPATRAICGTRA